MNKIITNYFKNTEDILNSAKNKEKIKRNMIFSFYMVLIHSFIQGILVFMANEPLKILLFVIACTLILIFSLCFCYKQYIKEYENNNQKLKTNFLKIFLYCPFN